MVKRRPHDFEGGRTIKHLGENPCGYSVYRLTFPNGMQYIGVNSRSVEYRRDCGYGHNMRLKDALRSCGWKNVIHELLSTGLSQEEAFAAEKEFIQKYRTFDPNVGYNVSPGGKATFAGLKHSEEARKRISKSHKGATFSSEHKANISAALKGLMVGEKNPMYGKPKSEETILRQYAAHRKEMKPVVQLNGGGDVLGIYASLHQASKATGVARSSITKNIQGISAHAGGYQWKYATAKGGDDR